MHEPIPPGPTLVRRAPPPADLRELVEAFHERRVVAGSMLLPVFPTARAEILFHFADPFQVAETRDVAYAPLAPASVLRPRTTPSWQMAGPAIDWFLVMLTPLGCRRLLGAPLASLWGEDTPLSAFWGAEAGAVWERLAVAADFEARIAAVVPALRERLTAGGEGRNDAARFADRRRLARLGSPSQIAATLGVTDRRVRQSFALEIGRSPKTMLRIVRFGRYIAELHPRALPDVFADGGCDYFDDSHATREFRGFTGMTPGAYRRSKAVGDGLVFTGPPVLLGRAAPRPGP